MYLEQQKGEEDPMQIPRPLPTNKIPEVMGPTRSLPARPTSVDHGGVFSSCVNRFYAGRNRGEYRSLSIPRVTYTHRLFLI